MEITEITPATTRVITVESRRRVAGRPRDPRNNPDRCRTGDVGAPCLKGRSVVGESSSSSNVDDDFRRFQEPGADCAPKNQINLRPRRLTRERERESVYITRITLTTNGPVVTFHRSLTTGERDAIRNYRERRRCPRARRRSVTQSVTRVTTSTSRAA